MLQKILRFEQLSLYDPEAIVRHLEKMAVKGWLLEHIDYWGWRYRRIPSQALRFAVSYDPKGNLDETHYTPEQQDFYARCQAQGWTQTARWAQLVVFHTDQPDAPPLPLEPLGSLEEIKRSEGQPGSFPLPVPVWVIFLGFWVLGLMGFRNFFSDLSSSFTWTLANNSPLLALIVSALMLVYASVELWGYVLNQRKAKNTAQAPEYLSYILGPAGRRLQSVILAGILLCAAAFLITTPMESWLFAPEVLLDLGLVYTFWRWRKGLGVLAGSGISNDFYSTVLALAVIAVILPFYFTRIPGTVEQWLETPPISGAQLGIETEEPYTNGTESPFLGICTWGDLTGNHWNCTVILVKQPWLYDSCWSRIMMEQNAPPELEPAEPWGARSVFRLPGKNIVPDQNYRYLLLYEDVLVELALEQAPTPDQKALFEKTFGEEAGR